MSLSGEWEGRHVVVTGGAGFIGTWLVRRLLSAGARVAVIDNLATSSMPDQDEDGDRAASLSFILSDVCEPSEEVMLLAKSPVDYVFHLASLVGVRLVHKEAAVAYRTADLGTRRMLEVFSEARFIAISSSAVYHARSPAFGGVVSVHDADLDYDAGVLGYAAGKTALESHTVRARSAGQRTAVIRPFNIVGPGQSIYHGMVLPRFIDAACAGRALTVYDDGLQTRCFGDVRDFVEILLCIASLEGTYDGDKTALDIGSTVPTRILDLAYMVQQLTSSQSEVEFIPYSEAFPGRSDVRHRVPGQPLPPEVGPGQPWRPLEETVADSIAHYRRTA